MSCTQPLSSRYSQLALYGDGQDGDFTVLNTETKTIRITGKGPQVPYFNNVTINAGGTLKPWADDGAGNLYIVPLFVLGTLTINGTLSWDGADAPTISVPGYGPYVALAASFGGADGTPGVPGYGDKRSAVLYLGGAGGGGGASGNGVNPGYAADPFQLGNLRSMTDPTPLGFLENFLALGSGVGGAGGVGGSNGGNDGAGHFLLGGRGGNGGGIALIYARNILIGAAGKISLKGEAGVAASGAVVGLLSQGGGSGGGGGGGGYAQIVTDSLTVAAGGVIDVTGGAGGAGAAGANGGTAGAAGTAGVVGVKRMYSRPLGQWSTL